MYYFVICIIKRDQLLKCPHYVASQSPAAGHHFAIKLRIQKEFEAIFDSELLSIGYVLVPWQGNRIKSPRQKSPRKKIPPKKSL